MKINKTQWRVISNGIDRMVNLINLAGEQIRAIAILLRWMSSLEFEREKAECRTCLFGYSGDSDDGHIITGGECRERPPVCESSPLLLSPMGDRAMSICIADEDGTVKRCAGKPFKCINGPQDGITGKVCRSGMSDDECILDSEGEYREDIVWEDPSGKDEEGKPLLQEYRLLDEKTGTYIYSGVVNG